VQPEKIIWGECEPIKYLKMIFAESVVLACFACDLMRRVFLSKMRKVGDLIVF